MSKITVTQIRSGIGHKADQKRALQALGLHRLNDSVVHEDSASVRGVINKIRHLVKVEETSDQPG